MITPVITKKDFEKYCDRCAIGFDPLHLECYSCTKYSGRRNNFKPIKEANPMTKIEEWEELRVNGTLIKGGMIDAFVRNDLIAELEAVKKELAVMRYAFKLELEDDHYPGNDDEYIDEFIAQARCELEGE